MRALPVICAAFLAVTLAGCGGGDDAVESVPVPADVDAAVRSLGGSSTTLTEVEPGQVYRTPNGYLFGYCSAITAPAQTVTGDVCATVAPAP